MKRWSDPTRPCKTIAAPSNCPPRSMTPGFILPRGCTETVEAGKRSRITNVCVSGKTPGAARGPPGPGAVPARPERNSGSPRKPGRLASGKSRSCGCSPRTGPPRIPCRSDGPCRKVSPASGALESERRGDTPRLAFVFANARQGVRSGALPRPTRRARRQATAGGRVDPPRPRMKARDAPLRHRKSANSCGSLGESKTRHRITSAALGEDAELRPSTGRPTGRLFPEGTGQFVPRAR